MSSTSNPFTLYADMPAAFREEVAAPTAPFGAVRRSSSRRHAWLDQACTVALAGAHNLTEIAERTGDEAAFADAWQYLRMAEAITAMKEGL